MSLFDAIIVGSGPAGTFGAYELRGRNVLVLDVGYRPPGNCALEGNLYDLRQRCEDLFAELIGEQFQTLHNVYRRPVSLKLKAPFTSYVIQDGERLCPISSSNFEGVVSFAQGGLANAWGAGVFRFDSRDLAKFPITQDELTPFYDELTTHVGISGDNDDLTPYFGADHNLLPPIRISALAAGLLDRYRRKREFFQQQRIALGLARLAVLTRRHNGRAPYKYENLEFFKPYNPAIYNPVFTMDELVRQGLVRLSTGYMVVRYRELDDRVEVSARSVKTGALETFHAKHLLIAAGTLSTSKIVLESSGEPGVKLPILDNPMACIPLLRLSRIGAALDVNDSSLAQLNVICEDDCTGELLQGSIYGATGPLRSDVLFDLPLAISANIACMKYVAPAMALLMLFFPGERDERNFVRLGPAGELEVNYEWASPRKMERKLIHAFRKLGCLSASGLVQYPRMGSSLHYAGTLPMKDVPGPYETDRYGLLFGTRRVYICDGACFTELPAKNLTFTIMANAMRIARRIRESLA
jgi:choline dehydrogenase-like flavoprotein